MKSDACQRCHADIYKQWDSSMHHFSSFKQPVVPQEHRVHAGSRRHAFVQVVRGCHDPALLYSGLFDTPIKQIVDRPEPAPASAA